MPPFTHPETGLRDWRADDVHFDRRRGGDRRRGDGGAFWITLTTFALFFTFVGFLIGMAIFA